MSDRPDVVLISMESVRADRMPCYGYDRNTTPSMCSVAEDGTVFTNAYTPASHTEPALPAIALGRYPKEAGIYGGQISVVRKNFTTLAEALKGNGYQTYYINEGTTFYPVQRNEIQGYDFHSKNLRDKNGYLGFLDNYSAADSDPMFLRIHLHGAQYYEPSQEYIDSYELKYIEEVDEEKLYRDENAEQERKERGIYNQTRLGYTNDVYDEKLRSIDQTKFRVIVDRLKEEGMYENSIVVVVADHGEALGESHIQNDERIGHAGIMERETLHVPLIVKLPGDQRSRVEKTVSSIDIYPTVLNHLGLAVPPGVTGRDLFRSGKRTVFSHDGDSAAIKEGRILILRDGGRFDVLFNASGKQEELERMKKELREFSRSGMPEIVLEDKQEGCVEVKPYFEC